jgi:hypothetical protein
MLYRFIYIIFFYSLIIGCKTDKKQENKRNDNTVEKKIVAKDSIENKEDNIKEDNIINKEQAIISFIKFYSNNYDSLYQENFVDYEDRYYRIDFDNVNSFIEKINKNKFFSEGYAERIRYNFKKIDSVLVSEKQDDGVPEGLEYDFILKTQDIDEILNYAKQMDYKVLDYKNGFLVNFKNIHKLYFEMKGAKINSISIP